jgi:hypothetical protein
LGTLRAGTLCELAGRDICGRDAAALGVWQKAYTDHIGSNGDWCKLYAAVYERLTVWHRYTSVRSTVSHLAEMLLRQGTTSRQAWLSMCEVALVDALVPEPSYSPIFPSPTRPSSQSSNRLFTPQGLLRDVPTPKAATADADEQLVMEDRQYRYYAMDGLGEVNLCRRVDKATRSVTYIVTKTVAMDRQGRPQVRGSQHDSESAARRAMIRLAS